MRLKDSDKAARVLLTAMKALSSDLKHTGAGWAELVGRLVGVGGALCAGIHFKARCDSIESWREMLNISLAGLGWRSACGGTGGGIIML